MTPDTNSGRCQWQKRIKHRFQFRDGALEHPNGQRRCAGPCPRGPASVWWQIWTFWDSKRDGSSWVRRQGSLRAPSCSSKGTVFRIIASPTFQAFSMASGAHGKQDSVRFAIKAETRCKVWLYRSPVSVTLRKSPVYSTTSCWRFITCQALDTRYTEMY